MLNYQEYIFRDDSVHGACSDVGHLSLLCPLNQKVFGKCSENKIEES